MPVTPRSRGTLSSKVWIVSPIAPPFGGMSVQAERLRRRLLSEGVTVETIPTNPALPESVAGLTRIPVLRTILREIQYLHSIRKIKAVDIVHHFSASHLFFFLHSAPLLLSNRRSPRKLILNYRGGQAADFLRGWGWAVIPLLRQANVVTVPSQFLQQIFERHRLTTIVVPNLAETDLFRFVERKRLTPRLFVNRNLEPIYDVECVLRAFRIVKELVPDASLGVAGYGSEQARLLNLVQDWNLQGVTFYGAVSPDQLPSLYRQHDLYLNASRVDNFPGSLVEAACAGLPIVTTRAGGIVEMIRDRENGLLVDIGDHNALANSVMELLRNPDFAVQLARAARLWAEQFSWSYVFPKLLECYGIELKNENSHFKPEIVAV